MHTRLRPSNRCQPVLQNMFEQNFILTCMYEL